MDSYSQAELMPQYALNSSAPDEAGFSKRYSLLLLWIVIVVLAVAGWIQTHVWVENGRNKDPVMTMLFLPAVQVYVMLLSSILFCRTKPRLGAFDCHCCRWTRAEVLGIFLLIGTKLLLWGFAGWLRTILRLSGSPPVLLYGSHSLAFSLWIHINGILLTPIAEEMFWRGYVQSTLAKILNPWVAIVAQAAIFGMGHSVDMLGKLQLCLVGLIYGIWCHKRKTLLPLIIVHSLNNLVVSVIEGFDIL